MKSIVRIVMSESTVRPLIDDEFGVKSNVAGKTCLSQVQLQLNSKGLEVLN